MFEIIIKILYSLAQMAQIAIVLITTVFAIWLICRIFGLTKLPLVKWYMQMWE